jgi:hypothetical protein
MYNKSFKSKRKNNYQIRYLSNIAKQRKKYTLNQIWDYFTLDSSKIFKKTCLTMNLMTQSNNEQRCLKLHQEKGNKNIF